MNANIRKLNTEETNIKILEQSNKTKTFALIRG